MAVLALFLRGRDKLCSELVAETFDLVPASSEPVEEDRRLLPSDSWGGSSMEALSILLLGVPRGDSGSLGSLSAVISVVKSSFIAGSKSSKISS